MTQSNFMIQKPTGIAHFNTTAYFDGVRHLEFNREAGDMAGYIYYPNMQGLIDLLQKVRELELEICHTTE